MTLRVKVSKKHQIAVPAEVRRQANIEAGDQLLVDVRDGIITLVPEPKDYVERLRGLHKEVWEGIDVEEYINAERDSWES